MTDHRADQLAAILSQCDEFWMAGRSPQDRQPSTLPRDSDARDDSYHRLICDLIKQQIERDSSCAGDNPSRLEAYLHEHSDVPFSDGALLELIEYEFISRHRGGDWPDIDEYAEKFPHLESAVRTRLQNARDDVVTHASVCSVLQEGTATSPDDETREASPASLPAGADELAATLRQIRPFCDLSRHVREAVALHAVVRPFAAGDVLLRQGEAADALVILLEGTAEVWLNDAGQLVPIARLQRHTVVGELGLVTQEVRSATVSATSPGCAAIIDRQAFETLAGRYPRLNIALAELIAERVGTLAIDVLCGKTIDKYLIRRRLGRGATGIVYAATEAGSQRPVALKMLRHDLTYDRHAALRFQQEADIIGELQHPNIVAVLSEFTAYGTSFVPWKCAMVRHWQT
ncbi:MAG: cyclic nucleotide-binding serine/threonine-protein kinase [Planctomycetaceae bacterium]